MEPKKIKKNMNNATFFFLVQVEHCNIWLRISNDLCSSIYGVWGHTSDEEVKENSIHKIFSNFILIIN